MSILEILGWALCSAFSFWALADYQLRTSGRVTRGDFAFFSFWSLAGPFAAPWAVMISLFDREWPFWSATVWKRKQSERTGA